MLKYIWYVYSTKNEIKTVLKFSILSMSLLSNLTCSDNLLLTLLMLLSM